MTVPLSILIVDDNRTNLALMDMLVRKLPNCTTQLFTDPAALIDVLGTVEFDIAIFDYQMPGLNGIELTRSVKAEARLAGKPVRWLNNTLHALASLPIELAGN